MALENVVEVHDGKAVGAFTSQAKNISYKNGSVEDALDEVGADVVKVYNNSYTTESIAPDTTKTVTVTLPPSYNTILAVIPYSCSPNSSWESYPIVKTVTHATGSIQFRIIGSGSAQTYTIRYSVLYK